MSQSADPPPSGPRRAKPAPNAPPRRPATQPPSAPPLPGAFNIQTENPSYARHRQRPKSKSSSAIVWAIGAGVVALCVVGGIVFGMLAGRGNQKADLSLAGDERAAENDNRVEAARAPIGKSNDLEVTPGSELPNDLPPSESVETKTPKPDAPDRLPVEPPNAEPKSRGPTATAPNAGDGFSTTTPGFTPPPAADPAKRPVTEPVTPSKPDEPAATPPHPSTVESADTDPNAAPAADAPESKILALYTDDRKTLFGREGYPQLRAIFSEQFEQQHADAIRSAYAADYEEMQTWLAANVALKETFYTAIRPDRDHVPTALALMNQLRKEFPDQITTYGQLAIALAVVWDEAGRGIYDYREHAVRAKSSMPEELAGAIENFDYMVRFDSKLNKRVRYLPWEFLVLLVNHRTPLDERMWAVKNYFPKRQMFGKCYHDVPYDNLMLETQSEQAALNGHPYTLASIREHGGVCAMQADFAARVGKSIGVPAAYVWGPSNSGELHAWVMWVELTGANSKNITFTLESHGRYLYDKYYVGNLNDPQTGEDITDRTLELRLQLVGMDPIGKRHADLLMRALPIVREHEELDAAGLLNYLSAVIGISPGNEAAWTAIAQMSRDGLLNKKQHSRQIGKILDSLFYTFRNVPDFTWQIFDDLASFAETPDETIQLYARLVELYEKADRPDLACEARLVLADQLTDAKRHREAVEGLAATIMKFPDEGRYVPKLLDRLEQICDSGGGNKDAVLKFYLTFLPKVPQMRGDSPSKYCVEMFERAIERFKTAEQPQVVSKLEDQLEKVKQGKGKRE